MNYRLLTSLWGMALVWCGLNLDCLLAADEAFQSNPSLPANSAVLKHIELKSNEAKLTFRIQIQEPSQPVVLSISAANAVPAIAGSMTVFPLFTPLRWEIVEGASGAPHQISVWFPQVRDYEFSLIDSALVDVKPQYQVIATLKEQVPGPKKELSTKLHVQLLVTVKKPFRYVLSEDTTLSFKDGGVDRVLQSAQLNLNGSITYPDETGIPVKQNLAFWVNDSDFSSTNKAVAQLQFPMKGNWPKQLTLPGRIEFIYLDMTSLPITKESDFGTTIAKDLHILESTLAVSRQSGPELGPDVYSKWPQLSYIDKLTYETDGEDTIAYIRTNNKTVIQAPVNYDRPALLSLITLPGQETSTDLEAVKAILEKVSSHNGILNRLRETLVRSIPTLKQQESRIRILSERHATLVQSSTASEDAVKTSRARLESAKRAAEATVEAYNATVLSYPD